MAWSRPEASHISMGWMAGSISSWPPAASISWRMMASIFLRTRQARGI